MDLLRTGNVFEASKFCDIFSKIIGYNFVTIEKDKNNNYFASTTKTDIFRLIIGISYCIWLLLYVSKNPFDTGSSRSMIFELLIYINSRVQVINPVLVMMQTFYHRYDYYQIKKDTHWIDKKLSKLGVYRNYKNDRSKLLKILASYTASVYVNMGCAYSIVTFFNINFDSIPLKNVYFLVILSLPITWNVIFFIKILNIYWRYQAIKENLKGENSTSRLIFLMRIYDKLNIITPALNRYFVLNFVLSLFNVLLTSINTVFLIYDVIVHSLALDNFIITSGAFSYLITLGLIIMLIITYSSFLNNLNDEIIATLIGNGKQLNEKKLIKFCHLAILQVESSREKISSGLFEIDWKLVLVMVSSFVAYLIVLLQFDITI